MVKSYMVSLILLSNFVCAQIPKTDKINNENELIKQCKVQLTPDQLEENKREYLKLLEKKTKFRASFMGEVLEETGKVVIPFVATSVCKVAGSFVNLKIRTHVGPCVQPIINYVGFSVPPTVIYYARYVPIPSILSESEGIIKDTLNKLPSTLLTNSINLLLMRNRLHPLQNHKPVGFIDGPSLIFNYALQSFVIQPWLEHIRRGILGR